jgi:proteasome accessory factor B
LTDAIERLVNLALFFADARGTVTAEQARTHVAGYPADQDESAFIRMFERDKEDLRRAGLTILADDEGNYRLDRTATFSAPVDLDAGEAAAIRAVASALIDDPSFPYATDLRLALAKVAAEIDAPRADAASRLADESPARQGADVAVLSAAATACKRVLFGYTNSAGGFAPHDVEPYGLFLHDGRWYLVGRDVSKEQVRTYTVSRMQDVTANPAAPKTPDFERPEDFDIARFVRLPFQFGPSSRRFEAALRFDDSAVRRAPALCAGQGFLESADGGALWTVEAASETALLRFVLENGPGLTIVGPPELVAGLREGLRTVEVLHG